MKMRTRIDISNFSSQQCFGCTKTPWPIHAAAFMGIFLMLSHSKNCEEKIMEKTGEPKKNKGGRPPKSVKRNRVLALKCASFEKVRISARAKKTGLTVSEYLRGLGLNGQIVITEKVLPKEVLLLLGTLNHMAANLNQIAKKRNSVVDELNAAERASLEILSRELKQLVVIIKTHLQ